MFLIDAYRARRLEKQRTRLLNEAYARKAEKERAGREHEHEYRQKPREQPRPKTAPTEGRHAARNARDRNPFATDSIEVLPAWLDRANKTEDVRIGNATRRVPAPRRGVVKPRNSERAMPDVEHAYPRRVDSLPKRNEPANYHPRHGHRYLRPDEHMEPILVSYVQPLSCAPRAPGETNGYRGRLFHEGDPRSKNPPPRVKRAPTWAGPRPDGWI